MNKKIYFSVTALLITVLLTLLCCGCGNMNSGMRDNTSDERADSSSDMIEDAGEVIVNLPAAMFESVDAAKEEVKQILTQDGVKSAETAEDGSVRIVMTKEGHKKALEDLKKSIEEMGKNIQNDENSDTVTKLDFADDYSKASITVSSEEDYKTSNDNFQIFSLGLKMLHYRRYSGDENAKVNIDLIDEKTGKVFESKQYPQE